MATHGLPAWPWAGTDPADLPRAEALLLEAMRAWGEAKRRGGAPAAAIQPPLAAEDATAALPALAGLLRAAVPLALACPACPRIQPAEARLLLAVALVQRGGRGEALGLLLRLLPARAAYETLAAAIGLGLALRQAGLVLTNPLGAPPPCARPGGGARA